VTFVTNLTSYEIGPMTLIGCRLYSKPRPQSFMLEHPVAQGILHRKDISIYYIQKRIAQDQDSLHSINYRWSTFLSRNPNSFNGRLCRVDGYRIYGARENAGSLDLYLSDTDYKEFVGTRESLFESRFGKEKMANPLSVAAILVSNDSKLLIGRRSSNTDASKSSFSVVAGYIDPEKDISDGYNHVTATSMKKIDIFNGMIREIYEETGIKEGEIKQLICIGLLDNKKHNQINIPFYSILDISASEILQRGSSHSSKEFSELFTIDDTKEAIEAFLKTTEDQLSDIIVPILHIYRSVILPRKH
jgi:8-oxo-dGTP pyrophosphatase MutT (NUDIX family)